MKITVDIAEGLFAQAREVAQREGTTLRDLIEEGLRAALARREQKTSYQWPDLSISGDGLAPDLDGSWESILDRIYTDHGA